MLFSSTIFIFQFLPIALAVSLIARRFGYNAFLVAVAACSLYLYGWHVPAYLLILLLSAAGNYIVAGFIADEQRGWLYGLAIAGNLALLAYFKYANFLIDSANTLGASFAPVAIVLPLAISFITFEQIAFLSDVRSGRVPRGSPIEYLAFITLFPKLIAGPIIRYTEILPQIREATGHAAERIFTGLCIFSVGLFNKVGPKAARRLKATDSRRPDVRWREKRRSRSALPEGTDTSISGTWLEMKFEHRHISIRTGSLMAYCH
jgi:alginate O-acetyltransferase complex protein AlgI